MSLSEEARGSRQTGPGPIENNLNLSRFGHNSIYRVGPYNQYQDFILIDALKLRLEADLVSEFVERGGEI